MIDLFVRRYSNRFVSRHFILLIDSIVVAASFVIACFLRFNFDFSVVNYPSYKYFLLVLLVARTISFWVFRSHEGIIRHTSIEDLSSIFKAITVGSIITAVPSLIITQLTQNYNYYVPLSILIIEYFICLFLLISSRFLVKDIYRTLMLHKPGEHVDVLIYGAGTLGILTKKTLLSNRHKKYNILAFIDENPFLMKKKMEGVRVYSEAEAMHRFVSEHSKPEVILSIQNINAQRKNEIINRFLIHGIVVKVVPSAYERINGQLESDQIRNIRIEDLLERDPIKLSNHKISAELTGKVTLITGAAGSIGSEIVRQVVRYRPHALILLDNAESGLYDLENDLKRNFSKYLSETKLLVQVADVTDEARMKQIFREFSPEYVFHAAAYKHVPLMEAHPYEAVKVNVFGTKTVADLSVEFGASKFVMISTDKAVNPTNVMGATKRLAEMYVQSLNYRFPEATRFVTTRFGNVLGSNGSVVPLFQKQIQAGGPVTVTHPEVIRYFMTIPEACQLVLEAGTMGHGGEVFVFDMGEPVKIADLAKKMIQLSGYEPDKQVKIIYSGLRPGEKLYEELLSDKEKTLPTYHNKIKIAQVYSIPFVEISESFAELKKQLREGNKTDIVAQIKYLVPEFISNNSIFERLDRNIEERI